MKLLTLNISFSMLLLASMLFTSCNSKQNQQKNKFIIELISSKINKNEIRLIAVENGASDTQLYEWKNHLVLYSHIDKLEAFSRQVTKKFPDVALRIYDHPFYDFSKAERCSDTSLASEWEHILLTANLVENEAHQQEYMEYHRTQFEEWPEIAKGFCNADFQQLLLYRNGRQLMLVISIPADKTLDELNPKTVEDNPRMEEWNKMMEKYQEGIEGTNPEEVWVFLNKAK